MLLQRTLTALLLIPLALAIILWPATPVFALVVAAAFLVGVWEWTRLSGLTGTPARAAMLVLVAALLLAAWWPRQPLVWGALTLLGVCWWGIACLWLRHFAFAAAPTPENRRIKLLAGLFVMVPAWAALVLIHRAPPYGHWWTFLALAIVWAADIGAYFAGRFLGKRKLAPQISPGKTWAGVYGAFVAAGAVVVAGGWMLGVHDARLLGLIVLAAFTVAASIVGDLIESLMKRHAKMKDSGQIFPGHGGLLDRLDSVFAAMPVFALGLWLLDIVPLT
ncbi:phosphatidate cytidylyltransferase [Dyella sp.]|jgi:phosphatidate cytidylyltransferase|uniref:phosphatidate cytidylyltransferase n=1 Tax=Dyella sp. TaxID=1869338 RepID=UPI002D79B204|nr:phosphatidate cytidylyltransferase [Dyella sp.]HET6432277.1 phosphatidate cytidylyltransferase [Dyella sp.]